MHAVLCVRGAALLLLFGLSGTVWGDDVGGGSGRTQELWYPPTPFVVNVKQAPYGARGDGVTDDTNSLQRAIDDCTGQRKVVFLPAGIYLISRTLKWPKQVAGRDNWGFTTIRGAHRDHSILRLKPGTFTDPAQPAAMMWCGGFGSADWFHNYVEQLTFDVGADNSGATALQFYSNNSGAVRDCYFTAPIDSGLIGLDLAHRDMNGPLLVQRCEVEGFRIGIKTGHAVNSQTFEQITLRHQREFGFDNEGQSLSMRQLTSVNEVPAVRSYGMLCLLEATLTGTGEALQRPAMINYNGGHIMLRDITTSGYARALGDVATPDFVAAYRLTEADQPESAGPEVLEYFSHAATRPFLAPAHSLRLPIEEPPPEPWEDSAHWANVDDFGADPTGTRESAAAIQRALDSGASTILLPGSYALNATLIIRGKVKRLVGLGGWLDYTGQVHPDLQILDGEHSSVTLEHFASINGGLELATSRTLVMKSVADCHVTCTASSEGGKLFFEDVVLHNLKLNRQQLWARQLNIENEGLHLLNDGGQVWVAGYKTERGGTLLETRNGGRSEILGNLSYTTTAGKLAPMFVTTNASVFAYFGEVCFSGDPFATLIQETQGRNSQLILRGEGSTTPYISSSK